MVARYLDLSFSLFIFFIILLSSLSLFFSPPSPSFVTHTVLTARSRPLSKRRLLSLQGCTSTHGAISHSSDIVCVSCRKVWLNVWSRNTGGDEGLGGRGVFGWMCARVRACLRARACPRAPDSGDVDGGWAVTHPVYPFCCSYLTGFDVRFDW